MTVVGFRPEFEQPVAGRKRPADIFLHNWPVVQDAGVVLVVTHPLNHSQQWNESQPAVDRNRKRWLNLLHFVPPPTSPSYRWGSTPLVHGPTALAKLFNCYAKRLSSEGSERFPGLLQAECWQRVSVALHKGLGAQLSFALLGGPASPFEKPGSHQSTPPVSPKLY